MNKSGNYSNYLKMQNAYYKDYIEKQKLKVKSNFYIIKTLKKPQKHRIFPKTEKRLQTTTGFFNNKDNKNE